MGLLNHISVTPMTPGNIITSTTCKFKKIFHTCTSLCPITADDILGGYGVHMDSQMSGCQQPKVSLFEASSCVQEA